MNLFAKNNHLRGVILLLLTTVIWGTTFPLLKSNLKDVPIGMMLATRFFVGLLPLIFFLPKAKDKIWRDAFWLSLVLFIPYFTQFIGLQTISATRSAFITGLSVVLVPLFELFFGKKLKISVFISAFIALIGIALLSWENGRVSIGDLWTFVCAISYAIYIIFLGKLANKYDSPRLSATQLFFMTIFGLVWAIFEGNFENSLVNISKSWHIIVYLGLIATTLTILLQAVAQKSVNPHQSAIIYSLEPAAAALFSWWWLGETLGISGLIGAVLLLIAMIYSQKSEK